MVERPKETAMGTVKNNNINKINIKVVVNSLPPYFLLNNSFKVG